MIQLSHRYNCITIFVNLQLYLLRTKQKREICNGNGTRTKKQGYPTLI